MASPVGAAGAVVATLAEVVAAALAGELVLVPVGFTAATS